MNPIQRRRFLFSQKIKLAKKLFDAYKARVLSNSGNTESDICSINQLDNLDARNLLQSATFVLAPSGYKSGVIYSEVPSNGNGDLTVTRATSATRVNSSGLIESPVTNNIRYSQDFTQSNWTKSASSIGSNVTTSPDGNNAYPILENTSSTTHQCFQSITSGINGSNNHTVTLFIKQHDVTNRNIGIRIQDNAFIYGNVIVVFNPSTGSLVTSSTSGNGVIVGTPTSTLINGWYRIQVVFSISSSTAFRNDIVLYNGTNNSYAGNDPNTNPTGVYIWGYQLEQSNSSGIYVPTTSSARTYFAGITQDGTVAANVPQLDYSLGGCPNFLFEPQRRNICLRSESLDNAIWSLTGFSAFGSGSIVDSGIAPDGNQTADLLNESNVGGIKSLLQGISSTSGNTYTLSVYAKTGLGGRYFRLNSASTSDSTIWASAQFDLQNVSYTTGVGSGGGTVVSASITSVGNGWYRCVLTASLNSAYNGIIISASDGAAISSSDSRGRRNYIGVGNTYLFWGAQFEDNGSFGSVNYPTSYIPTTSAAVTRNATSFTRSNIYTNGLIGASGGTWLIELKNNISLTRDVFKQFGIGNSDTSITNGVYFANGGGSQLVSIRKNISGSESSIYATTQTNCKLCFKWDGAVMNIFENGSKVVLLNNNGGDGKSTAFAITNMEYLAMIGVDVTKYISQMALWNTPLSDAQCIALTS